MIPRFRCVYVLGGQAYLWRHAGLVLRFDGLGEVTLRILDGGAQIRDWLDQQEAAGQQPVVVEQRL